MKLAFLIFLSAVLSFTLGCKKEEDAKTGIVKLEMESAGSLSVVGKIGTLGTCPSGLTCVDPTSFKMKILAAYVVEDIDASTSDNVGQVGMVWLNPKCTSINDCKPSMVDYSDLTDPTEFNTLLNSQALPISTGTYRYVRIEFCQGSADDENVQVTNGSATKNFTYGGCGVTSEELSSPIFLEEGQSIKVSVSYDLSDGEVYWAAGQSCPSATDFCIGGIDLVPSIVQ